MWTLHGEGPPSSLEPIATTALGLSECVSLHSLLHHGPARLLRSVHTHLYAAISHRDQADSVAWALSKMLGMSQQCAAFFSKWPMILVRACALSFPDAMTHYPFPSEANERLQCGLSLP
jgi:hypothetical protein